VYEFDGTRDELRLRGIVASWRARNHGGLESGITIPRGMMMMSLKQTAVCHAGCFTDPVTTALVVAGDRNGDDVDGNAGEDIVCRKVGESSD